MKSETATAYNPRAVHDQGIVVRAKEVVTNGDGTFTIVLPVEELTTGAREMISDLFPHLSENVYNLLRKEVLLSAIISER